MIGIDVNEIKKKAQLEIQEEATKGAVGALKELYEKRAKAQLVVTNIDREIEDYLNGVQEKAVYALAGIGSGDNQ